MICITDSVICNEVIKYKNWNLDPFGSEVCAFCTTLYIFQRGQPPDIHVQFLGFLVLMNYLPGQIPLKMPLNSGFPYSLGLLLLTAGDCSSQQISAASVGQSFFFSWYLANWNFAPGA